MNIPNNDRGTDWIQKKKGNTIFEKASSSEEKRRGKKAHNLSTDFHKRFYFVPSQEGNPEVAQAD